MLCLKMRSIVSLGKVQGVVLGSAGRCVVFGTGRLAGLFGSSRPAGLQSGCSNLTQLASTSPGGAYAPSKGARIVCLSSLFFSTSCRILASSSTNKGTD